MPISPLTPRCVSPETRVLTERGWQMISDHANELVQVWNGINFTRTYIRRTGSDRRTYRLTTDGYEELWSTLNHKYFVFRNGQIERVMLHEVRPGDELLQLELPKPIDGRYPLHDLNKKVHCFLEDLSFIPDNHHSLQSKVEWLSRFLQLTDFSLLKFSYIQILHHSANLNVLRELKWFLMLLGCKSKIVSDRDLSLYFELGQEDLVLATDNLYHLLMGKRELIKLYKLRVMLGRDPAKTEAYLNLTHHIPRRIAHQLYGVFVADVDLSYSRITNTYCFNEPRHHIGYFNGILTGQSEHLS